MYRYSGEDLRVAYAATAGERARRSHSSDFMSKPKAEQDAWWIEQEKISAMRRRAKIAYQTGRPAPMRRRDFADPPLPNRQYVTIETTVFRDPRMSKTEAATLAIITAWAGTNGYADFTHTQLGEKVNRSRSTMKRVIKNLKAREYLDVEILRYPNGKAKCLRLRPTDQAWPFWHSHRQDPEPCGFTPAPPITNPLKGEDMEDLNEPDDDSLLEGMDPEAVRLYREIVSNIPMTDALVEKTGMDRGKAIDHLVKLIVTGHLVIDENLKTGEYSLVPTKKVADVVPKDALRQRRQRRRRLFRP